MFRIIFLRWWLFMILVAVGCTIGWKLDFFQEVYDNDQTSLSLVIMAIFVYMSIWCGSKSWVLSSISQEELGDSDERYNRISRYEEIGWFVSEQMLTIGMIGTVAGFIMMLGSGFIGIDLKNTQSMLKLIGQVASGMATALYTTLMGLVCSLLMKVQYFNLSHGLANLDMKRKKDVEKV